MQSSPSVIDLSKGQVGLGRKREVGGYGVRLTEIPEVLRGTETRDK